VIARNLQEVREGANRHKVWAGTAIVVAFLAAVVWLPKLSFIQPGGNLTPAERAKAESDLRGHLLQALGGLVLVAGAYFTGRTFALNREGQITERFTRAVEQLANDEKLDIRLGGIYALERIARDSETHYEPVMEVLTAFLREHARWRPENGAAAAPPAPTEDAPPEPEQPPDVPEYRVEPEDPELGSGLEYPSDLSVEPDPPELRVDFQAAATVLGRRDRRHERPDYRLNLSAVGLQRASLQGAHLGRANLSEANLEGAVLTLAKLEGADLDFANLKGASLCGANLEGASLWGANLENARLRAANLSKADLGAAFLLGADLKGAFLSETTGLTDEQRAGAKPNA
jgi:hypothetical protein